MSLDARGATPRCPASRSYSRLLYPPATSPMADATPGGAEGRPAQVGVQHHSGGVDHPAQGGGARPAPTGAGRCSPPAPRPAPAPSWRSPDALPGLGQLVPHQVRQQRPGERPGQRPRPGGAGRRRHWAAGAGGTRSRVLPLYHMNPPRATEPPRDGAYVQFPSSPIAAGEPGPVRACLGGAARPLRRGRGPGRAGRLRRAEHLRGVRAHRHPPPAAPGARGGRLGPPQLRGRARAFRQPGRARPGRLAHAAAPGPAGGDHLPRLRHQPLRGRGHGALAGGGGVRGVPVRLPGPRGERGALHHRGAAGGGRLPLRRALAAGRLGPAVPLLAVGLSMGRRWRSWRAVPRRARGDRGQPFRHPGAGRGAQLLRLLPPPPRVFAPPTIWFAERFTGGAWAR